MLCDLTNHLALLEGYSNLRSTAYESEEMLRDLGCEYVSFYIDAGLFSNSKRWDLYNGRSS
jgi:hypothetical protein